METETDFQRPIVDVGSVAKLCCKSADQDRPTMPRIHFYVAHPWKLVFVVQAKNGARLSQQRFAADTASYSGLLEI
jgi:hypothetical protein